MRYPKLLAPLHIGGLTLSNRIVMPPLFSLRSNDTGEVTPAHLEHYSRCSGPGLIIVEITAVLPEGRVSSRQVGAYSDRHIEGLASLAENIHAGGAVAGIQIHHAGLKSFQGSWMETEKRIDAKYTDLDSFELEPIGQAFVAAARRVVAAGFDLVELHSAHGYLLSQLLSRGGHYSSLCRRRLPLGIS